MLMVKTLWLRLYGEMNTPNKKGPYIQSKKYLLLKTKDCGLQKVCSKYNKIPK